MTKMKTDKNEITVKFMEWTGLLSWKQYANGQRALQLIDIDDGMPLAMATVAIDHWVPDDCIAVKNYSENEGMVNALHNAGVIIGEEPFATIAQGTQIDSPHHPTSGQLDVDWLD